MKSQIRNIIEVIFDTCKISYAGYLVDEMVNLTLLSYISLILEYDKSTYESIYQYIKDLDPLYFDANLEKKMKEGISNYKLNVSIHKKFAIKLGLPFLRGKYKKKNKISRIPHSLIKLEYAYAYAKGYIDLYILIYKNKNPFSTTHRDTEEGLIGEAYQKLYSYIDELNNCSNSKERVAKNIFLWKFEKTYRFIFVSILAEYIFGKKDIKASTLKLPELLRNYYYPYYLKGDNTNAYCMCPIISYDAGLINSLFETEVNVDNLEIIQLQREMLQYALAILCTLYPPQNESSHKLFYDVTTQTFDFDVVEKFVIGDCKLTELFTGYKEIFKENMYKSRYLRTIRELLLNNSVIDQERVRAVVEDIKNKK